jgi:hypothetical protein
MTNDFVAAWLFVGRKERSSLHDLSRLAVAALRDLQIHPSPLQWMIVIVR